MSESSGTIKLSVLVPAFNMAPYLSQCLDSIIAQKVNFRFQILVAEDSSTDNTKEIARDYEKRYPDLVKVFYNATNLGASRNLCNLIDQVNTELYIQIDGDDYITDNSKLQIQVDAMDKHADCAMCFHNYVFVDSNGNNPRPHTYSFSGDCYLPKDYLLHHDLGPGNLVMVRRSCLPKPLPEWIRYSGFQVDYLVHCLAVVNGKIYYIDKIMTAYRKHAQSITSSTKRKSILEMKISNPENLGGFYRSKGLNEEADFFKSILPKRYMELGYFYLSEGNLLNFARYFLKGFIRTPIFNLKEHKDMIYTASPELARKLKEKLP